MSVKERDDILHELLSLVKEFSMVLPGCPDNTGDSHWRTSHLEDHEFSRWACWPVGWWWAKQHRCKKIFTSLWSCRLSGWLHREEVLRLFPTFTGKCSVSPCYCHPPTSLWYILWPRAKPTWGFWDWYQYQVQTGEIPWLSTWQLIKGIFG